MGRSATVVAGKEGVDERRAGIYVAGRDRGEKKKREEIRVEDDPTLIRVIRVGPGSPPPTMVVVGRTGRALSFSLHPLVMGRLYLYHAPCSPTYINRYPNNTIVSPR